MYNVDDDDDEDDRDDDDDDEDHDDDYDDDEHPVGQRGPTKCSQGSENFCTPPPKILELTA